MTIKRVFSLLLIATTMASASLVSPPAGEARHCAKGQRQAVRKYQHNQIKSNKNLVKKTNNANRRSARQYNSATKRYYRHH